MPSSGVNTSFDPRDNPSCTPACVPRSTRRIEHTPPCRSALTHSECSKRGDVAVEVVWAWVEVPDRRNERDAPPKKPARFRLGDAWEGARAYKSSKDSDRSRCASGCRETPASRRGSTLGPTSSISLISSAAAGRWLAALGREPRPGGAPGGGGGGGAGDAILDFESRQRTKLRLKFEPFL